MAQLVQWGGAPAALARDSELRGHAKRGAPCTSQPLLPPTPLPLPPPLPRCFPFERVAPVSHICNVHSRSFHSELGPARLATRHARRLRDAPGCVCSRARAGAPRRGRSVGSKRDRQRPGERRRERGRRIDGNANDDGERGGGRERGVEEVSP